MQSLIGVVLPIILNALIGGISTFALKLIAQQQANANATALGGSQVVAQTNVASADAERRAQDAMAAQPGLTGMLADLALGKF